MRSATSGPDACGWIRPVAPLSRWNRDHPRFVAALGLLDLFLLFRSIRRAPVMPKRAPERRIFVSIPDGRIRRLDLAPSRHTYRYGSACTLRLARNTPCSS